MFKLFVMGISTPFLSQQQTKILSGCDLIICSQRFRELINHLPADIKNIAPLQDALRAAHKGLTEGNVAILAGGDPLFYGIGKIILRKFSHDQVEIFPAISSVQLAGSRLQIPWDDAIITSLHGRNSTHIPGQILTNHNNIIFTDGHNSPDKIAHQILDYLKLIGEDILTDSIEVHVASDLGLAREHIFKGDLHEATKTDFSALNIMWLLVPQRPDIPTHIFGLTEEEISHSRGLITKNEVRAATIHALQLKNDGILWDIGAGSGSVSVECARTNPQTTIYAIEHKEEGFKNITTNIKRFGCYNIVPVFGRAPEAVRNLPDPDSVFIGGSGGSLAKIIALVRTRLKAKGKLVINGVTAKTVEAAPSLMRENDFHVQSSVISVTRTDEDNKRTTFNSITIITGRL